MAQEIDITGLKKNFNTTVVGDSVIVITQYAVRTVFSRQYYPQNRVFEFNNRPVDGVNYLTFETPLVVTRLTTRLVLSGTSTNNAILVTGQAVKRAGTSTQVNIFNTASLFVKGSIPMRLPINMYSGGVGTVNTFTSIPGQPNIYGVALATTATWAFAIEQLPTSQTSGLSVNSIITVNTSSNSTGNFGTGNTAYVYQINAGNIVVVATSGTSAPVNGTIEGITNTGQTFYVAPVAPLVAQYLIVGGGGGGGSDMGGGGGAGGYLAGSMTLTNGTYSITVGAGGAGAPAGTSGPAGSNGNPTIALGLTALGGGGGASKHDAASYPAGSGGSGGGGSGGRLSSGSYGGSPGTGTAGQGNNGAGSGVTWYPGGGGGAGAAASQTGSEISHGGVGISNSILGTAYFWAGGGGGAGYSNFGGNGGLGGGGGGAPRGGSTGLGGGSALNSGANATIGTTVAQTNVPGGNAGANTGGGGGGGSHYNSNNKGGDGGSGIVVVRYSGAQRATGGTVTTVGGDTVHAFTATGVSSLVVSSGGIQIPTFRDPIITGWQFTVTNLASTVGYKVGDVISSLPRTGRLGNEASLVYLTDVNTSSNSISGISLGTVPPLTGNINAVYPTGQSLADVVISNVSTTTPYTFLVSGLKSVTGLVAGSPGSVITATSVTGSFGAGNTVIVYAILGYTSLLAYVSSGTSVPIPGVVTNFTATGATATLPIVGQTAYTTPGTYSWTAPTGVTSVSVVAVGGGGGGGFTWSSGGGGGGGLGWKNNISVTPGQSYTVQVGAGGPSTANATNAGAAGGTSFFISTATVAGFGGGTGGPNSTAFGGGYGGGYVGDSGGRGGNGAYEGSWTRAGAGAGGYSGNGADSGSSTGSAAATGSGGGGAGGYYSSTYGVPAGGGVGILGRGADGGAVGNQYFGGLGGSGGAQGTGGEGSGQSGSQSIAGGAYGGGGGGSGTSYGGGPGGRGAVRIIWGTGRSFPVTLTTDQGAVVTLPTITSSFKNENVGGSAFVYPSSRIESIQQVLQQNNVPRIIPVEIKDPRRLVLQRQIISKTGSEFSLRNNSTEVQIAIATTSQQFSTGTLSFTMPLTTNPGAVGFIGTVTQLPIQPNIYGVAAASSSSWAFAVENLASTQTSGLSFGRIVTASTGTGNFGTGNTVWVFSTATAGIVILIASGGSTPPVNGTISGITITGGIYNPPLNTNVDLLLVGGGGSGGNHSTTNANGGGGAGGLLYGTNISISTGTHAVVIGQGGAAVANATAGNGNRGTSSTFGTVYVAQGGGGGVSSGVAYNAAVNNGGSGGGFAQANGGGGGPGTATQTSMGGATGYGNAGGGNAQGWTGAGGGGAGTAGVGGSGGTAPAGDGGRGRAYDISGSVVWYAGGGGGGGNSSERAGDGYAGGGRGAGQTTQYAYNSYPAQSVNVVTTGSSTPNAIPNTGGGGGGGSYWAPNGGWGSGSGAGGSGIAIVRYLGAQAGSGGIITSANGYTIHTFLSDGTFVFNGSYGLSIPTFRAPVQSPWTFSITGTSVASFTTGSIISATPRIGTFGSNNEVYVTSVDTSTNSINCFAWAKGPNSIPPSRGLINAIYPTGDFTVPNPIISGITTFGSGYRFTISNIKGTLLYNSNIVFTATSITGSLGTGSTAVIVSVDSFTQIQAYASGGTAPVAGFIGTPTLSASTATFPVTGDASFVVAGTYSWTAPAGVTSVSVVAVGGGGAGWSAWANSAGSGGGLGWKNNITVVPGTSYTVQVGAGGVRNGGAGGNSFFISLATVSGYGGGNASSTQNTSGPNANSYGGGWVGDGGGAGGNAANYQGGGGAGGYSGNGGNQGNLPAANSGGAAGGGYYSSTYGSGAGGGVGIWGRGDTATGWWHGSSGQVFSTSQGNGGGGAGGSGGVRGRSGENPTNSVGESGNVDGYGGAFGGGGGGPGTSWPSAAGSGGGGAVRIIWGSGRAFPATNAGTATTGAVVSVAVSTSTPDDNIGGDSNIREALMSISTPRSLLQNTVPTQVPVTINSSIRSTVKNLVHVPTNLTNSTDYESAPSVTTFINSSTTGTYVYRSRAISSSSWIFRIYNIPSATVSSLTTGTIITANTSSVDSGNFGVGNTVSVYTITSATSVIAIADLGTSAPVAGPIDSISIPGGTYTYTPPITGLTSVAQYYTVFNGTSQYLTVPANTAFAFGTGDFTIEAWVYLTVNAGSRLVTTRLSGGGASGTWSFSLSPTTMGFTEVISGEPGPTATFSSILNTWTHLAAVRSSGVTKLYLNGTEVASAAQTTNFNNSSYPLYIATSPSENFIGGYVSNLRIVKGTAVYTSSFAKPTASVTTVTNTQLLICKSATQIDLSVNAFTITPVNSPTIATGTLTLTEGQGNSAPTNQYQVAFNGTNQYLTTPSTANYNLSSGDFTVECWVYVTSNGNNTIFTVGTGGSATWNYWQINSDRSLSWQTNPAGNWNWVNNYVSAAGVITLNTWTHIAAVRYGSNFSMYVNGVSVYSTNSFSGAGQSGTLFIGTYYANYNNDGSYFRGNISNFRIVKGTAVYTSAFTTLTVALAAITNTVLLICRSATFVDLSTNVVTITPVNSPTISVGTLSLSNPGAGTLVTIPTALEDLYLGKQTAFVAVVAVSSATSYFKNRSFTARLQSPSGLPNNLGTIKDITPTPVSGLTGPWTFTLSDMHTTAGFSTGSVITSSALSGSFGANNTVRVLSITSSTEMVCIARSGNISPTTGTVAYVQPTGAIELGPVISTVTSVAPNVWSFVVSNLTATTMLQVGSVIVATTSSSSTGSFGTGTVYVSSINNISQIVAVSTGSNRAPVAGFIDDVTTSGTVTVNTGTYQTLTFIANPANLAITNNGTTDVTIFKNTSNNSWNTEARVAQGYTAPCTLEFFKQAGGGDNGSSYAMMGWNEDPTTDVSYTSMDYAAYPYQSNSYVVAHAGTDINTGIPWDPAKKLYIVYTTDGFIKHYNGSTLLFSIFYGIGKTVYIDSSFYSANGTFGGFSNIRVKNAAWLGPVEYGTGSTNYSLVRVDPNVGRQDNWGNIVSNVVVNTLNRPVNYFGNETTDPTIVVVTRSTASIRNAVVPMFEFAVNPGNISNVTTITSTTWSFTIDGMRSTSGFTTGTIINSTAVVGSFGLGNQVTVTGITSSTSMICITSFGTGMPRAGSITGIYATGELEPVSPYIEKVIGVSQLTNTTSYSVSFNPAFSSYLQYPNSTQFNLVGGAWTVECWLKPTGDYVEYRTIFTKRVSGSGTTSYQGYLRITTGAISFYNGTEYVSDYTLTPNVWSHCAWVYTGSILNIYVNGVVRYSVAISLGANNTEPLVIGVSRGYADYFSGLISNFRLVKNVAVYTGPFTPPTSPLDTTQGETTNIVAISTNTFTSLLVCQTNTFTDRSIYSTATTIVGTPSISVDNPFGNQPIVTGPWSYIISGLTSTNAFFGGAIITATTVAGDLGNIGTGTSYVNYAINNRQIFVINNTVGATVTPGSIAAVSTAGAISNVGSPTSVYQVAFNGSNQYLTTPTAPFAFGANNFTVEAWVNLNAMPTSDAWPTSYSSHMIVATIGTPSLGDGIGFIIGQTKLLIQNNDTQYAGTAHGMSINTWYHLAYVRNGNAFYFYVNGVAKGSVAFSGSVGTGSTGYIGCETGQGAFLNGRISNLRIVKNTAVYTTSFSTPTVEPANITDTALIVCRSSTFIDVSTNAVTVTPVNSPVISIGTLVLSPQLGAFPASNYTATVVYPSLFGSRVILQGGDVALSTTIKSFDTEQTPGLKANVWSTGTAYGSRHINWETMTVNSPYVEGQVTGEETGQPFTVYTRDATVNYGKVQWPIPEPMNLIRGQAIATSTVVVGTSAPLTYVRSTSTGSINAFRITPTTLLRNTFVPVSTDVGAIGTVETVYGGGPWSFTISGLQSVSGFTTGSIISSVARIGSAGQPGNVTYVSDINTVTNSITCGSYGANTPSQGVINSVYPTGEFLPPIRITSITTITGSSWFFTITGIRGTTGLIGNAGTGTVITVTTASGSTSTVGSVSGNSLVVAGIESQEQIKVYAFGGTTPRVGIITNIVTTSTLGSYPIIGDAEFTTPGTYTWVAPAGITTVSVVAVGGGGAGFNTWANAAGAGAGLGWKNGIAVTSGTSYTVQVGAGGVKNGGAGGNSFFISTGTVAGYGGGNASSGQNTLGPNANGYGGGYFGDGGGAGGNATNQQGGGGAGGYSGNGGNARSLPGAGSGAAAGGGYYSSTYGTGAGGGVGIWGRGETATGWWHGSSGQVFTTNAADGGGGAGGSGGTRGLSGENPTNSVGESGNSDGYGGTFGGGGGGPGTSWPSASGSGGKGGVRIIWGIGRGFPATIAGTFTSVVAVTTLSTRSSLIGGPLNFWETQGVITNRMPYPESIGIDRLDTVVITDTITDDAVQIKLFAFNNLSSYSAGSKSITNSLVGSETFFVAGTGTDTGATTLSAYWI